MQLTFLVKQGLRNLSIFLWRIKSCWILFDFVSIMIYMYIVLFRLVCFVISQGVFFFNQCWAKAALSDLFQGLSPSFHSYNTIWTKAESTGQPWPVHAWSSSCYLQSTCLPFSHEGPGWWTLVSVLFVRLSPTPLLSYPFRLPKEFPARSRTSREQLSKFIRATRKVVFQSEWRRGAAGRGAQGLIYIYLGVGT